MIVVVLNSVSDLFILLQELFIHFYALIGDEVNGWLRHFFIITCFEEAHLFNGVRKLANEKPEYFSLKAYFLKYYFEFHKIKASLRSRYQYSLPTSRESALIKYENI
jgi:hypothetical protein